MEHSKAARYPNASAVIVLNQSSASRASCARNSAGASSGLVPPAPSTSVSRPLAGRYTPATEMASPGRHQAVADIHQPRLGRRSPAQQLRQSQRTGLGLGIGGKRGLRHRPHDRGNPRSRGCRAPACDSNAHGIDQGTSRCGPRTPATAAMRPGSLRRDDVAPPSALMAPRNRSEKVRVPESTPVTVPPIGLRRPTPACPGYRSRPGRLEQLLLGEHVLRIQHQQLRPVACASSDNSGDQAGALVGTRRAAVGVGRHGHQHRCRRRGMRLQLPPQQQRSAALRFHAWGISARRQRRRSPAGRRTAISIPGDSTRRS